MGFEFFGKPLEGFEQGRMESDSVLLQEGFFSEEPRQQLSWELIKDVDSGCTHPRPIRISDSKGQASGFYKLCR